MALFQTVKIEVGSAQANIAGKSGKFVLRTPDQNWTSAEAGEDVGARRTHIDPQGTSPESGQLPRLQGKMLLLQGKIPLCKGKMTQNRQKPQKC